MDRGYSPWRHKESDTTEWLKLNLKYTIPSSSEFLLLPSQPAWIPCHLSYLLRSSPSPPSHFLHCTMWAGLPPFVLLPLSSLYTRSFYILSYLYITPSVSSTQYLEFTENLLIAFFEDYNVDNYYLSEKRGKFKVKFVIQIKKRRGKKVYIFFSFYNTDCILDYMF